MIEIIVAIILAVFSSYVNAQDLPVSRFVTEGLTGWESKSFKDATEYCLLNEDGRTVVKAFSKNAESGLFVTFASSHPGIDVVRN